MAGTEVAAQGLDQPVQPKFSNFSEACHGDWRRRRGGSLPSGAS
jgi:hypothetical protein